MKKLVYLLSCLFLLSAGFAACSNETDDPPEQPSSHQNETPIDSASVEKDTTEVDSTEVPTDTIIVEDDTTEVNNEVDGYCSMLVNGRAWYYEGESVLDHRIYYFSLLVLGDTIVDNLLCKKIYYVEGDSSHIRGFAYEKEGKVFMKSKSDDPVIDKLLSWEELYDFTLDVGERNDQYNIWLSSTDSISIDNVMYHRYYYTRKEGGSSTNTFVWIEGIGSEYGLLNPIGMFPMSSYVIERFLRCYDFALCIITAEDFHKPSTTQQ